MIEFLFGFVAGIVFVRSVGLGWLDRFRKEGLGDADHYKVGGSD